MFHKIVYKHMLQVGWIYASGRSTKTEYQCAMEYLRILQLRVHRHYLRLRLEN